MNSPRRVVITGLGVICPLGNTPGELRSALSSGTSGVARLASAAPHNLPMSYAAEARGFTGSIDDFGPLEAETKKAIRKGLKLMCRESQMGVAAAQRAINDAGFGQGGLDPDRSGVVFGSDYMLTVPDDFTAGIRRCLDEQGNFDFSRWGTEGIPQVTPLWLLKYLPNMPASHVAIFNDLRGPNNSLTLREASSNAAVGEAFRTIARGSADVILAGATGTRVHPMKMVHSVIQEEVANSGLEPAHASRPFDLHRQGMVLGEGAGAVVLEEFESARARGAKIYAEVVGTATSSVASSGGVARREAALANVMAATLRDARAKPQDVGHLHAHALATRSCDEEEARAIRSVFDDVRVPVTAAKSYFGNLGAASGLVELVASILALDSGRLFPVLNYETPDPNCPVDVCRSESPAGKSFLTTSVTPQGQASAVMLRTLK
jgi:3-oxoacyl-[acyl-carrier-protein] synthase II